MKLSEAAAILVLVKTNLYLEIRSYLKLSRLSHITFIK